MTTGDTTTADEGIDLVAIATRRTDPTAQATLAALYKAEAATLEAGLNGKSMTALSLAAGHIRRALVDYVRHGRDVMRDLRRETGYGAETDAILRDAATAIEAAIGSGVVADA